MDEYKRVEKRTEIREDVEVGEAEPKVKTTNVNVGPDGTTQVQEEEEVVEDDPVSSTIIRQEETIEKHQR